MSEQPIPSRPSVERPSSPPRSSWSARSWIIACVTLVYQGLRRVVEPHLVGIHEAGEPMLVAFQTGGFSHSGDLPGWRTFITTKVESVDPREEKFTPRLGLRADGGADGGDLCTAPDPRGPRPSPGCGPSSPRRQRGLRRGEPRDRHPEGRAGDVVHSRAGRRSATAPGSPPCSPQMPSLRSCRVRRPSSQAISISLPTPAWSSTWNGSSSMTPCSR